MDEFDERAREMIVRWRDLGFMRVGTPQIAINELAQALRDSHNAALERAAYQVENIQHVVHRDPARAIRALKRLET